MFLGARNRLQLFPKRSEHSRVLGIDCDYSRNDPSPPDLTRTPRSLKPPCLVSFLTFSGTGNRFGLLPKRYKHPRTFPIFLELSRNMNNSRTVAASETAEVLLDSAGSSLPDINTNIGCPKK
ncbi:hypothetical protein NQ317_004881, partial [Molorchus minor]